MSIDAAIRAAVLGLVPELVAAVRAELARPKLIPIKSAPVAYRALLDAERRGELPIYRVGHGSFVDELELYTWIKNTGASRRVDPEPTDEIDEILAANEARRQRRGGHAA